MKAIRDSMSRAPPEADELVSSCFMQHRCRLLGRVCSGHKTLPLKPSFSNLTFSKNTVSSNSKSFCRRIPAVKPGVFGIFDLFGRRKRSFFFKASKDEDYVAGLPFDPTLYLGDGAYCAIAQKLPKVCLEINLGQLWSNDEQELARLTKEDIITALNSTKIRY